MFKKLLLVFVAVFCILTLSSCKERTYKADGVYLAFDVGTTTPQITVVKVTIKNDKVESFYIDCLQSTAVKNTENVVTAYNFNAQSKKQLLYKYGMHNKDDQAADYTKQDLNTEAGLNAYKAYLEETGKKEWFQQAELLANYALSNGTVSNVTLNGTKLGDNAPEAIASVSINVQNYFTVMQELLDAWK